MAATESLTVASTSVSMSTTFCSYMTVMSGIMFIGDMRGVLLNISHRNIGSLEIFFVG